MNSKIPGKGTKLPSFPKYIVPTKPNVKPRGKGIGKGPNGGDSFDDHKGVAPKSKY